MNMKNSYLKDHLLQQKIWQKLLILSIMFLFAQVSFAQFEEGKTNSFTKLPLIIGTGILTGASNTYTYAPDAANNEITSNVKIKNNITLRINENLATPFFATNFTATVYYTVVTKATATSNPVTIPGSLTVNYDKALGAKYTSVSYKTLPSSQVVTLTVNSVNITGATGWNPLTVLSLENNITEIRYYDLQNNLAIVNAPVLQTPDALYVSWSWPAGTNQNMKQLEWAWVENEMAGFYNDSNNVFSPDLLLANNATRIDLDFAQDNFKIPMLYDGVGKLYYRVRPTLLKNSGALLIGTWTASQVYAFNGHDSTLNWQSSTSYAENGKSKSVIQYFDGSLRGRQTVTKDNTTNNTVVAETIYDLQGRSNIQILPTPTLDNSIQYFTNFNAFKGMAANEDPAKYFDLTPAAIQCNGSYALDTTKGNGKYYSANNPWLASEANARYIPNANGFAYTETRFMDDATERVRSQGGVGATHQIGSNHETKYYYGKPNQTEIDALFGTEVGDASHYSKNMVLDANSQVSVSYTDMHGRTIATALAGAAPASMNDISTNGTDYPQASGVITNQLLTPFTNLIKANNTIESVSTILATNPTAYNFTYKLDPSIFSQFSCTNQQICFDCKYDLQISIKSEDCGTTPILLNYNNIQIQPVGTACTTSAGFSGMGKTNVKQIDTTITLGIGSWVVRKTLTINDSMYQIRRDSALKVFLCKTQQNIYDSVYNVLYTTSGCGLPANNTAACDSCNIKLGTFNAYRINYLNSMGIPTYSTLYDAVIKAQYSADSLDCAGACGGLNPQLTTLKSLRRTMLSDMMPFTGQYAIRLDSMNVQGTAGPDYTRLEAKYNIFSDKYNGIIRVPYYRLPIAETGALSDYFSDVNVVDALVEPLGDRHIILDTISPPVFTSLASITWPSSLIFYHPEFSKLKFAEQNLQSSYDWFDNVQGTDKYSIALSKGYTDPLNAGGTNTLNADPFFAIPANASIKTTMSNKINIGIDGSGTAGNYPSIWQIANSMVMCTGANNGNNTVCSNSKTQLDPSITTDSLKNFVWEQFRSMYLSYRNELVLNYIDNNAINALSALDKSALIANGKQIVFANQQNLAVQSGLSGTIWTNITQVPPDTTGLTAAGGAATPAINKCEAQRPAWKARLKQCEQFKTILSNATNADTVRVNNIINKICDGLVLVCNNSITTWQPFGASNVNPTYTGSPQNFEEVINKVLADSGIVIAPGTSYFCNPYTIDYPKPYGLNPTLYPNYTNTIDSCGCERFAALKREAGADSATLLRMNNFLRVNYKDTLSTVLWAGFQNCNAAFRDSCTKVAGTIGFYVAPFFKVINATNGNAIFGKGLCQPAVIINMIVQTGSMTVNFAHSTLFTNCTLFITDVNNNILYTQNIPCTATQVVVNDFNINPCNSYNAYIISSGSDPLVCSSGTATSNIYNYKGCKAPICDVPFVNNIIVDPGKMTITYGCSTSYSNSILYITDEFNTILYSQVLDCSLTQVQIFDKPIDPCKKYNSFIISDGGKAPCISVTSNLFIYNICPTPVCPGKPIIGFIRAVPLITPNGTQDITLNYSIPAGGVNCTLQVFGLTATGINTLISTQAISCNSTSFVINLPNCIRYRFLISSDYTGISPTCGILYSDTAKLDRCTIQNCIKIFTPITLPSVVIMPSFIRCGYVKPCITCGKLDTLTIAFRTLYANCAGVPYISDVTATTDQTNQNALWARYLNYKTGFGKTAQDYIAAYKTCHPATGVAPGNASNALCALSPAANSLEGLLIADTTPCQAVQNQTIFATQTIYQLLKDSLIANFDALYRAKCLGAKYTEQFYVTYQPKEYHYTLYYYDQASNLVKTMPPAAVKPNFGIAYLAGVTIARTNGADAANTLNNEALATHYRYNSLNQVIAQKTPDAKTSNFWYDVLGRLVISQNAKQQPLNNYSYTLYDVLGRINEVGQVLNSSLMTQAISQNALDAATAGSLANWLNTKPADQITKTFYDNSYLNGSNLLSPQYLIQQNLRNRVSATMLFPTSTAGNFPATDNHTAATYYSYDIHGNVDTLLQDLGAGNTNAMNSFGRFKKMVYNYDLISGKVNSVAYQPGKEDAFYHRYGYDAENRLTIAETSKDSLIWEKDAQYSYYRHGPLARSVIGQLGVQGIDYAYTLQGWLKGVNSNAIAQTGGATASFDMGKDAATGINSIIGQDAYSYSLNYFANDYVPIGIGQTTIPNFAQPFTSNSFNLTNADAVVTAKQLYNGNIASMMVNIPKLNTTTPNSTGILYGYKYDQLNRISSMDAFTGLLNTTNVFTPVSTQNYKERVTYDPNGNIKTYLRNGDAARLAMDNMNYTYKPNNNQLDMVLDAAADATVANYPNYNDIKTGQVAGNYTYDLIGNLISDVKEGISNVNWTVYGKINSLTKTVGSTTTNIDYGYDAGGNRISKKVAATTAGITTATSTYYVRDASGNVMSIYTQDAAINTGQLTQTELHLYGSSRLGLLNTNINVQILASTNGITNFIRGNKFFELSNHLGNVLVTVSDKKIGVDANTDGIIDYYNADVITANDFYVFGSLMPGRKYSQANSSYRYGFNGKENDNDVKGEGNQQDYGMRIYDPRLGRFLSVDPKASKFADMSPYCAMANNPIFYIDPDGQEIVVPGEADRKSILGYTSKALGGDYFSFNDKNQLQFTGNIKDFKKDKKDLINGLLGVINADYTATIKMSGFNADETKMLDDQSKPNALGEKGGGVSLISIDNKTNKIVGATILIRESDLSPVPLFNEKYYYKDADGVLQSSDTKPSGVTSALAHQAQLKDGRPVTVPNTAANVIFHEIGHLIYEGGSQRDVLKYENKARKLLGMPQRSASDPEHQ